MHPDQNDPLFTIVERGKKEWESTVDSISEGVALYDEQNLNVCRANWPLARWLNTTPHRMVGASLLALLDECELTPAELENLLRSPEPAGVEVTRHSTGQQWELSVFPIHSGAAPSNRRAIVIRDVTQEKQLQQGIIDAEKRAAMIRTVSSLAQQIIPSVGYVQQQLAAISAHMEDIRSAFVDYRVALRSSEDARLQNDSAAMPARWEDIEARHRVEFMLTDIEQAIQKATLDLMRIYKPMDDLENLESANPRLRNTDINWTLENTISFIWPDLDGKITIERRYQKSLPYVRCDPIRLQTALMSLVIFCTQHFQEKGRLKLATRNRKDEIEVTIEMEAAEQNGPAQPLDSFETNTGLAHSIIQEHQGALRMHTERGKVSACITLPVAEAREAAKALGVSVVEQVL